MKLKNARKGKCGIRRGRSARFLPGDASVFWPAQIVGGAGEQRTLVTSGPDGDNGNRSKGVAATR